MNRAVRQAADRSGARVTLLGISRGSQGVQTYPDLGLHGASRRSTTPCSRWRATRRQPAHGHRNRAHQRTGRIARGGPPAVLQRQGGARGRLLGAAGRRAAQRRPDPPPDRDRRRVGAALRRRWPATWWRAPSPGGSSAWRRRPRRWRPATSPHRIPIDCDDELGDLARAFNDMQRQLAQLDSARKRFIAIASHELRTPIFSLGGFVELLQDEDLDEETRQQFLDQMARADRAPAQARRPSCSTSRRSRPARWSCAPSPPTWASWRGRSRRSSRPRWHHHDSHLQLRLRATGIAPPATASGWPRSCAS